MSIDLLDTPISTRSRTKKCGINPPAKTSPKTARISNPTSHGATPSANHRHHSNQPCDAEGPHTIRARRDIYYYPGSPPDKPAIYDPLRPPRRPIWQPSSARHLHGGLIVRNYRCNMGVVVLAGGRYKGARTRSPRCALTTIRSQLIESLTRTPYPEVDNEALHRCCARSPPRGGSSPLLHLRTTPNHRNATITNTPRASSSTARTRAPSTACASPRSTGPRLPAMPTRPSRTSRAPTCAATCSATSPCRTLLTLSRGIL